MVLAVGGMGGISQKGYGTLGTGHCTNISCSYVFIGTTIKNIEQSNF